MLESTSAPRRQTLALLLGLLGLVALLAVGRALRAESVQSTVLRCDPQHPVVTLGEPVSFTIYVQDVVDLYAADVRMSFDPTKVHVVDANPAKPGTQIEMLDEFLSPDFVLRDVADNVTGTIWYANSQVNPSEEVSGSGALARITMQSSAGGTFLLVFTFHELVVRNGDPIETTAIDCRVTIFDPNTIRKTFLPVSLAP